MEVAREQARLLDQNELKFEVVLVDYKRLLLPESLDLLFIPVDNTPVIECPFTPVQS